MNKFHEHDLDKAKLQFKLDNFTDFLVREQKEHQRVKPIVIPETHLNKYVVNSPSFFNKNVHINPNGTKLHLRSTSVTESKKFVCNNFKIGNPSLDQIALQVMRTRKLKISAADKESTKASTCYTQFSKKF